MSFPFVAIIGLLFWLSVPIYSPSALLPHPPPDNPLFDLPPALFFTLSDNQGKCALAASKARGFGLWYKKRNEKKFIMDLGLFAMDEKKTKYVVSTREAPARSMYEGIDTFFVTFNGQLDTLVLRVRPPQTGTSSLAQSMVLNGKAAKQIMASNDMPTYYQVNYQKKIVANKIPLRKK